MPTTPADANGQVTNYLWDEESANGDVAVETDVSHTPQARYILGNGQLVGHLVRSLV